MLWLPPRCRFRVDVAGEQARVVLTITQAGVVVAGVADADAPLPELKSRCCRCRVEKPIFAAAEFSAPNPDLIVASEPRTIFPVPTCCRPIVAVTDVREAVVIAADVPKANVVQGLRQPRTRVYKPKVVAATFPNRRVVSSMFPETETSVVSVSATSCLTAKRFRYPRCSRRGLRCPS